MKNNKGLTLIELLITIAVIAIVASISVPAINNVIDSAKINRDQAQAVIVMQFIDLWKDSGVLTQEGDYINGYLEGSIIEKIEVPEGYTLTGDGTAADPYALVVNPPAVTTTSITASSGSFDGDEGTTFSRDATGITITTASANWQTMSVQYTSGGSTITDTVFKKMASGTTDGILTKISNNEVRINTTVIVDFTFGIVYNGGSVGSYTFQ